jgi:hypothetical protein
LISATEARGQPNSASSGTKKTERPLTSWPMASARIVATAPTTTHP